MTVDENKETLNNTLLELSNQIKINTESINTKDVF